MIDLKLLRGIIYFQWIFWIWLLKSNIIIKENWKYWFYNFAVAFAIMIHLLNLSFEFYYTHLIILYIAFVLATTWILNNVFEFKIALCLGFLLTFINSGYWEFMLHLTDIYENGFMINQLIQFIHFIPTLFLVKMFKFKNNKKAIDTLLIGLFVSCIVGVISIDFISWRMSIPFINIYVRGNLIRKFLFDVNRTFCLYSLIKIFGDSYFIKFKGDLKNKY